MKHQKWGIQGEPSKMGEYRGTIQYRIYFVNHPTWGIQGEQYNKRIKGEKLAPNVYLQKK